MADDTVPLSTLPNFAGPSPLEQWLAPLRADVTTLLTPPAPSAPRDLDAEYGQYAANLGVSELTDQQKNFVNQYGGHVVGAQDRVAYDVVKSALTGMGDTAASFVGLPSTLAHLASRGTPLTGLLARLPTSQDARSAIEGVTGEWHEPETELGRYARNIGGVGGAAPAYKVARMLNDAVAERFPLPGEPGWHW